MAAYDLSDYQWGILHLLVAAKRRGINRISRMEIMSNPKLPVDVMVRLTFAMLTIPNALAVWVGQHDLMITPEGEQVFELRFGKSARNEPAPSVICLPGPEAYKQ